jgi:hypothetical protein
MKTNEQIAIECGALRTYADVTAYAIEDVHYYKFTPDQLNAYTEAVIREYLSSAEVVAWQVKNDGFTLLEKDRQVALISNEYKK